MPSPRKLFTAAAGLLLTATASQPLLAQPAEQGLPQWLEQAMARESAAIEPTELSLAEGRYRFQMRAKDIEAQAIEGGWYFTASIGAGTPLECVLLEELSDLAALAANLAEGAIQDQEESQKAEVNNRQISALDAGALEQAPFMALEWMFTLGEAHKAAVGVTKVRVASNGTITQACTHNEVGYRETFRQAFDSFVSSAVLPAPQATPYYEEIALVSLGKQRIGVGSYRYSRDEEGDTSVIGGTSMAVPIGPGSMMYEDNSTVSWSNPQGELINAKSIVVRNGELVTDLDISRDEEDNWLVKGSFQTKPLELTLDGAVSPLSELGQAIAARELFTGDNEGVTFPAWLPDADPGKFLDVDLSKIDDGKPYSGRLQMGPMLFDATFDEQGTMQTAQMPLGANTMTIERIWHRGKLQ